MHEKWNRIVRVEEVWCEMGLLYIHMSDEEPWVIEQFHDWKWD